VIVVIKLVELKGEWESLVDNCYLVSTEGQDNKVNAAISHINQSELAILALRAAGCISHSSSIRCLRNDVLHSLSLTIAAVEVCLP
jgi:hypothetical protein